MTERTYKYGDVLRRIPAVATLVPEETRIMLITQPNNMGAFQGILIRTEPDWDHRLGNIEWWGIGAWVPVDD